MTVSRGGGITARGVGKGGTGERQLSCITNAQREDVAFDQSRHFAVSVVVVARCCCCLLLLLWP